MANPSLQIGNSNWAIKKDNLLGYSTAGTRFLPIPITMTRASAGTRVNPQGLVETVELLGSENIDLSSFVSATNWAINGSEIEASGTTALFKQPFTLGAGKTFKITIVVDSITSGNFEFWIGGYSEDTPTISVADTYTYYVTSGGSESYMGFNPHSNLIATISSVSVKESTRNDLARVDYTGSTSSLLAEPQRTNTVVYSSDFSQYLYGGTAPTLTTGQLAPDGTYNATKISGVIGSTSLYRNAESSTTASRSIYARTVSGTGTARLTSYNSNTNNLFTLTEEWQRFELTGSNSDGGTNFYAADFRGSQTLSEFIIWGCQSEEATYATSIIPTNGSTVTRVKDQYSKTGISDKIGQTEGSIYFEFKQNQLQSYTQRILTLYSDSANLIEIQLTSSNELVFVSVKTGESAVVITKSSATTLGSITKVSVGYKAGDFVFYVNGVQAGTDTDSSKTIPQMDNLLFSRYNSTAPFLGSINSLKLYKTRLTNSELIALTT